MSGPWEVEMVELSAAPGEGARFPSGRYASEAEAIRAATGMLLADLRDIARPGDSAESLLDQWSQFGEAPVISGPTHCAWDAMEAAKALAPRALEDLDDDD